MLACPLTFKWKDHRNSFNKKAMIVEPRVNLNITVKARASKKKKPENARALRAMSNVKISMTTIRCLRFPKS